MKSETKTNLRAAQKDFGNCAAKVSKRTNLTPFDRELIVGFGTARDWIRWAAALEELSFSTKAERKSSRAQGIVESVRFTQVWTATNALFSKEAILREAGVTGPLPPSEQERYRALFSFASVDPVLESTCLRTLLNLLEMECAASGVVSCLGRPTPTMWEVIDQKYARPEDRNRGIGKIISDALNSGNLPSPDAVQLIYGARNWTVHGMLLTSFFRGSSQKYITFIDNVILLLSAALKGVSANMLAKL